MRKLDPIRKKVRKLEARIAKDKVALSKLRDRAKPEPIRDYEFLDAKGKRIKLSSLFGNRKELVLIHNMGAGCAYCTLWADGFNSLLPHLQDRAAFVVESPDRPKTQ